MVRTTSGTDTYSVVMMKGMSLFSFLSHSSREMPLPSGSRTSDRIRLNWCLRINARAAGSFMAVIASYPACSNQSFCRCERLTLSSTISIFRFMGYFVYGVLRFRYQHGDMFYNPSRVFFNDILTGCLVFQHFPEIVKRTVGLQQFQ